MSRSRKQAGRASPQGSRNNNRRRRGGGGGGGKRNSRQGGASFWGASSQLPPARQDVRITEDPAATVRSLGPPPLAGHEAVAEHYFAAVYDRAVGLAGALAAAGGLIEPEELQGRDAG